MLVLENLGARVQPAHFARPRDDAIVALKAAGLDARPDALRHLRQVLGMLRHQRHDLGPAGRQRARRQREQLARALRDEHLLGDEVPFPVPGVGTFHGARVALLGESQRFLGTPALRDVPCRAAPAHRLPGRVADTHADVLQPADLAAHDRAQFHAEPRAGAGKELGHRALPLLQVLAHQRRARQIILTRSENGIRRQAEEIQGARG